MGMTSSLRGAARLVSARLFPGRFALAGTIALAFVAAATATRLGLAVFNADPGVLAPHRLALWLALGLLYDLAVASFVLLPFALLAWLAPDTPRSRRAVAPLAFTLAAAACVAIVFVAAAEFVFWNEFGTRFNFIAVDYLVYTNEVIGNIRESYPMPLLLGAVGLAATALLATIARPLWRATEAGGQGFGARTRAFAVLAVIPLLSLVAVDARYKDATSHTPSAQLAGNGWYEFLHAFWMNELDYPQFYRTLPGQAVASVLRHEFDDAGQARFTGAPALSIEREVVAPGPARRLNVVLLTVESLSADFMGAFGNAKGLTPHLDALAAESLLFTQLYATGTRTVRGLEAVSLSMPPTPGHSIVKRPNNGGLRTLGSVFAEQGYEPIYLYGGYSYFDNMRAFFGGNGYTVIDREALPKSDVHMENIWGVADEDLFTLALRELDARAAAGRPFFAHVMTTSNHRPYTYPDGRIDIPSGTGRDGAVKYTDWAIGDFIARARARPWFDETVFVILADHCASSRGKTDLPLDRFHIPMLIYAPQHVAPRRIDTLASQIDVGPTLLALLGVSYRSSFFGQDILTAGQHHPRALLGNYQTVGYLEAGVLVELRPKGRYRFVDAGSGAELPETPERRVLLDEAIAHYQAASEAYRSGGLRMVATAQPGEAMVGHATR